MSSYKKSFYELKMSHGSNNCPQMVFLLYGEISGCAIDLVYGAQCKCKCGSVFLGFPVNLLDDLLF